MANTPANAGSSEGQVSRGNTGPRTAAGHRAARPRGAPRPHAPAQTARAAQQAQTAQATPGTAESGGLAWLPYLIALAGVAAGVYLVFQGSQDAGRGTGLIGCSLLAAGLARLVLPPSLAGLLSTRRKASDVLAFTVFGAGVLAVAILLP